MAIKWLFTKISLDLGAHAQEQYVVARTVGTDKPTNILLTRSKDMLVLF